MPARGALGSVTPSSPMNTSSEARSICHTDRLLFQPLSGVVRTPSSLPLALTISGTRVGSAAVLRIGRAVAPRASLLWKPRPQLA